MQRNIRYIVVHSTATPQDVTVKTLLTAWKEEEKRKIPPYHCLIKSDGEVVPLLHERYPTNIDLAPGSECIHIAYIGGINKEGKQADTRTKRQEDALFGKLVEVSNRYPLAEVAGKDELCGTQEGCPHFDVKSWVESYLPDLSEHSFFEDTEFMGGIAA